MDVLFLLATLNNKRVKLVFSYNTKRKNLFLSAYNCWDKQVSIFIKTTNLSMEDL